MASSRRCAFLFRQADWPAKLWWVSLAGLVPILGLLLLRGWRVAMVRRIGLGDREPLPRLGELGRLLADGLVLWTMKGLYWLPELVLLVVFGRKLVQRVLEVLWWAFEKLFGGDTTTTLGTLYHWTTGHLYGRLAARCKAASRLAEPHRSLRPQLVLYNYYIFQRRKP